MALTPAGYLAVQSLEVQQEDQDAQQQSMQTAAEAPAKQGHNGGPPLDDDEHAGATRPQTAPLPVKRHRKMQSSPKVQKKAKNTVSPHDSAVAHAFRKALKSLSDKVFRESRRGGTQAGMGKLAKADEVPSDETDRIADELNLTALSALDGSEWMLPDVAQEPIDNDAQVEFDVSPPPLTLWTPESAPKRVSKVSCCFSIIANCPLFHSA